MTKQEIISELDIISAVAEVNENTLIYNKVTVSYTHLTLPTNREV